jgi:hypothetical protein
MFPLMDATNSLIICSPYKLFLYPYLNKIEILKLSVIS